MIRIGIVEDDPRSRLLLREYIDRYGRERGEEFLITEHSDGTSALEGYTPQFDILLLDIEMPGVDGYRTAQEIRQIDADVVLVFITNSPEYAIRGYEVGALSYLLKPVPYFAFSQELSRSLRSVARRRDDSVVLPLDGGLRRLSTSEILFCESSRHRVLVHTFEGAEPYSGSLTSLETKLVDKGFHRCNSGYLVNLRYVAAVRGQDCTLTDGRVLRVSRPRKREFLQTLADFLDEPHR